MDFNELVGHIADVCPPFNDYAMRGFVKEHIDNSPKFPAMVLEEGFKLVNADLELVRYTIMSPEERVKFELRSGSGKATRPKVPLTVSHLRLVQYEIRFQNQYVYTKLYTPYMFDDMLFIRDKRSMVRKVILEKTFNRVNEKDKDGLSVSPIRVNLHFNRRHTFRIVSYTTGDAYTHFIIGAKLFHGQIKHKVCDTTIMHYMLAKFGFQTTLKKFGLSQKDINFVAEVGSDTDTYEYFAARSFKERSQEGPGLFIKVKKTVLMDDQAQKFVVNLLYVLSFFDIQTIDNVFVGEGWHEHPSPWKIILGIIIFEERVHQRALQNAETNLKSVDHFIDPLTRDRFTQFGVTIKDTYDLLIHIFTHIDAIMVNRRVQDLYHSRLDVSNGILVESFAERMFQSMYRLAKKTNIGYSDVNAALRFNPMMFRQVKTRTDDSKDYIAPPEIIGDNFLLSGGLNKIRMGGRPEQRVDPSMVVAESINAFVGKQIGKTGYLNPYIPTDSHGAIIHPDYASDIDEIAQYLPK